MQVMCQEAVRAGRLTVAAKALTELHSHMVALSSGDPSASVKKLPEATCNSSLTEASCLRALLICLGPQDKNGLSPDHAELARVFSLVTQR